MKASGKELDRRFLSREEKTGFDASDRKKSGLSIENTTRALLLWFHHAAFRCMCKGAPRLPLFKFRCVNSSGGFWAFAVLCVKVCGGWSRCHRGRNSKGSEAQNAYRKTL